MAAQCQKIGTDRYPGHFQDGIFPLWKNIMDRFSSTAETRRDVLIVIIKSASGNTGCFSDVGYSDPVRASFLLQFEKAPRMASSATEYLSSGIIFCIVVSPGSLWGIT